MQRNMFGPTEGEDETVSYIDFMFVPLDYVPGDFFGPANVGRDQGKIDFGTARADAEDAEPTEGCQASTARSVIHNIIFDASEWLSNVGPCTMSLCWTAARMVGAQPLVANQRDW